MSQYALVETGGKQYKFVPGKSYNIEKMTAKVGESVVFDQVVFVSPEKGDPMFGAPYVAKAKIKGTIVEHFRDKKIKVVKFKRRKGYMRTQGHRQNLTKVKIDSIEVK